MIFSKTVLHTWVRRACVALLGAVLVACGGGAGDGLSSANQESRAVSSVESYTRTTELDAGVNPIRSRNRGIAPVAQTVQLGILEEARAAEPGRNGPLQIGVERSIPQATGISVTSELLKWKRSAAGGQVAAVSFNSSGAKGIRLGILVEQVPPSATFRVYAQDDDKTFEISGNEIAMLIERNLAAGETGAAARTYWTPSVGTNEVTLEVALPPDAYPGSLRISVPSLSHFNISPEDVSSKDVAKIGESASCEKDVSCSSYGEESNSVAKMVFIKNGGAYLCTGTLLNDATSSGTPYFLSANHCISSQSVASTLVTYWFYRSASCNSSTLNPQYKSLIGGATLLYASGATDTSFMRLNSSPPVGTVHAAWTVAPQKVSYSSIFAGIHHPQGDLQKISTGYFTRFASCFSVGATSFSCSAATASTGNFMRVMWTYGIAEGGSSGSGLFSKIDGRSYLVGQLWGGTSSCSTPLSEDTFGRFDVAYDAALGQWLGKSTGIQRNPIYRFYSSKTGAHFFTSSFKERDYIIDKNPGFSYEGVAFYAPVSQQESTNPVFRFYNRATGAHFYTISAAERDYVVKNFADYSYEGPAWYGRMEAGADSTGIYRFYSASRDVHFYTINAAERDYLIANSPYYKYEGPAYYAWASQ